MARNERGLKVKIDTRGAKKLFRSIPKIANQEANRTFRRVISEFAKMFSKRRLGTGKAFKPSPKNRAPSNPPRQPKIPAIARRAGLRARLRGQQRLERKRASLSSSNPLLVMREKAQPVTAKGGGWLYIHVKPSKAFRGRGATKRRATWEAWRRNKKRGRVIVAKVKKTKAPPKLHFYDDWRSFAPRRRRILAKCSSEIARRVNRANRPRRPRRAG